MHVCSLFYIKLRFNLYSFFLSFWPNLSHTCRLLVPGLELIYLWNGFSIIGRHYNLVESVYVAVQVLQWILHIFWFVIQDSKINTVAQEAEESWRSETYSTENSCLLLLLRGVCLRYMGERMTLIVTPTITQMTIYQVFLLGRSVDTMLELPL